MYDPDYKTGDKEVDELVEEIATSEFDEDANEIYEDDIPDNFYETL